MAESHIRKNVATRSDESLLEKDLCVWPSLRGQGHTAKSSQGEVEH